jgi:hypothetical protein
MTADLVTVAVAGDSAVPFGIEVGAAYELIGPDGTRVSWNDATDRDFIGYVSDITGLDGPDVRESSELLVEGDGGRHFDFYHGRRPITMSGLFNPNVFGAAAARNITRLLRATNAMRGDAYLRWTATGAQRVEVAVRRTSPPRITGQRAKSFLIGMTAADPRIYGVTTNVQAASVVDSSGAYAAVTASNVGSVATYPTISITGPITNPILTNATSGKVLSLTRTIAAGDRVDLDFTNRTIKTQAGSSVYSSLNYTTSEWWPINPGSNSITLTGTFVSTAAQLSVGWRDAWL